MQSLRARVDKLESTTRGADDFIAVVSTAGLTEAEAEAAIEAKTAEAQSVGYDGVIVILDE